MSKAITFSTHEIKDARGDLEAHQVREDGTGRRCSTWIAAEAGRKRADANRDLLNIEHANGRVAQGHCGKGHACDRDRIHVPLRDLRPDLRAVVILCDEHAAAFAP